MIEFIEWLAWGFNDKKLGKQLWKLHDAMIERRHKKWRFKWRKH